MRSVLITVGQLLFSLVMYAIGTVFFGIALAPGVALFFHVFTATAAMPALQRYFLLGLSLGAGYFIFGFTLIFAVGFIRMALGLRLKEGNHPIFSFPALSWAFISSLYLLINFTFIDFILLTPFANLLQRMLGARLGRNVQINSKFIFDASLIEIGDNTVVGGDAIIIGHIVERGILKLKKVKIGRNVTIGSHATVMPGCEIGDHAIIGAGAVLLKNTKVEPRAVYFGVPAVPLRPRIHKEENPHAQNQP